MDTTPQNKVKPLLPQTIHIKSLYTYNSYLVKRPKHTRTFKFSKQSNLLEDDRENQTKSELKLQNALSHLKSVKKVDLSRFQVKGENLNQNRFQACLKQNISKASSLLFTRHQYYEQLGINFAEKPLKHLAKLRNLVYELTAAGLSEHISSPKGLCNQDPLRYLRYCPKIESLQIGTFTRESGFSKIFSRFRSYPTSLKRLSIKFPRVQEEQGFVLHLERFLKLKSIYFKFDASLYDYSWTWKIDGLPQLSWLEDIRLECDRKAIPEIYSLPTKIKERKMLKKLCLIVPGQCLDDKDVLKALPDFDQLTHFELNVFLREEKRLEIVSECLESMKQLQDLSLTIRKYGDFQSSGPLGIICQKIQNLQALRHLDLSFSSQSDLKEIPNLIVHCKPVKLETLSLIYPQQNPTQSLLDLAVTLKDSLTSLRKLRISFGSFSPDQQSHQSILQFISSLSNLQVLEMIGLDIEGDNFLFQLAKALSSLKSLEELTLGDIKEQVTPSTYEDALQVILSKRGLRRFECQTCGSVLQSCGLLVGLWIFDEGDPCRIDMEVIERKNPFIESIQLSDDLFALDLLKGIAKWS